MMKHTQLKTKIGLQGLLFFILCTLLASCSKKSDGLLPTEFYNARFGANATEVKERFAEHQLKFRSASKDGQILHFNQTPYGIEVYMHTEWDMVDALFDNGKFCTIRYMNAYKTKGEAQQAYKEIGEKINAIYKLRMIKPPHDDILVAHAYKDQQGTILILGCSQYTSTEGKELYNVKLEIGI